MKRILFSLLSALILFSCAPSAPVQTAATAEGNSVAVTFNDTTKLYFNITADGEAALTWDATEGKKYNTPGRYQHRGTLVLPSQITVADKVYKVTSIADNALFQQRSLAELYIPDGIRHIGDRAISGCDKLLKLRLPETLETVGYEAFARCKRLEEVKLPNSIQKMGRGAMYDCKSLRKVEIPTSMTVVSEALFSGCFSLKNVKLHDKITTIEELAFNRCEQLQEVNIPNSVTEIKD
ncbi:MAG: leucine-rich repeat domain-containing protein, partial [Bacteroidaceae bacterium]|nr:leucine-rich repeat domain-containing protein [Bacteroidaceae bacterium]